MKKIILSLIILLFSLGCYATGQAPDYLIYKGDTMALYTNPLGSYFKANGLEFHELCSNYSINSGCWRGYIAYFEIRDNKLYVVNVIVGIYQEKNGEDEYYNVSVMDSIFPNQKEYFLKEFTGTLKVPKGEMIEYTHMSYASEYESYLFFQVDKGNVLFSKEISNKDYKEIKLRQYNEYVKTDKYKEEVKEVEKDGKKMDDKLTYNFFYMFFEPDLSKEFEK